MTNLLLHLAAAGAFEPIWSEEIHSEWMRALHCKMGLSMSKIEYRRAEMERAFPAAKVAPPPALVATIQAMCRTVAQRKDAHVIATAVAAKAELILTHNVKDFPAGVLMVYGLSKARPDAFCIDLLANREAETLRGLRRHRASLKRTPMSEAMYIDHLAAPALGMPNFAQTLALFQSAIY